MIAPQIKSTVGGAFGVPLMKFTLTYDGELPSSGNSSKKAAQKWEIRKQFHPQLMELTMTHPVLIDGFKRGIIVPKDGSPFNVVTTHHSVPPPENYSWGKTPTWDLCERLDVKGRKYWPIVRESLALVCNLKILFLRKENPGNLVLQGGDLDNRIKTLFDALRMPTAEEHIDDPEIADPMICLLENDTLITGVELKTDRLLRKPNSSVHEVQLLIEVDVRLAQASTYNLAYLGD